MTPDKNSPIYRRGVFAGVISALFLCLAIVAIDILMQEFLVSKRLLQMFVVLMAGVYYIKCCCLNTQTAASYEDILSSIFQSLNHGVLLVTEDGSIVYINDIAKKSIEQMPDFVVSEQDGFVLPVHLSQFVRDCFTGSSKTSIEIATQKANDLVFRISRSELKKTVAKKRCALVEIVDITEIKKLEKTKRDFISNFSHEIKTPIAAIRISAETLAGGAKDDPKVSDKFLNNIVDECDRLAMFIDNTIRIARFDSENLVLSRQEVNICELINNILLMLGALIEKKSVRIVQDVPEDLVFSVNEYYLSAAVKNLIDNAIKYSNTGGEVSVKARIDSGELVISIADNGIGIPQGDTDRVFERFYRVDKARTYYAGGSGLGLAIVKTIADLHNGHVDVTSILGSGSIFTLHIPSEAAQ